MFHRTQGEKKHIMAFKISPVPTQEEYDAHFLEIVYSHLKLRQLQQKINAQVGASDGSLSNSMMVEDSASRGPLSPAPAPSATKL